MTFFFCVFLCYSSYAQTTITAKPEFTEKTNFALTDEWQYLTTDFYLFNEDKFNYLINQLGEGPSTNLWGKLKSEKIEFLSLTASILNVKFFGAQDLIFPLFNFKIDYSKENKYKTQITDEIEVVRLINNLPLATTNDIIDAKIKGEAITDSKGNQIMRIVSQQLKNISKITDPSSAVLTVVGELGSFLESSSRQKQYQFTSTIRLYDDSKFNMKLHSINVYVYIPKDEMSETQIDYLKIRDFISKLSINDEVRINKTFLSSLITYDKYPYFIVVNYKSKYVPLTVEDDKIDINFITAYEKRVTDDCREGLNSKVVCIQENALVSFYKLFASFKQSMMGYDLNYKNQITSELNMNLFLILKDYRRLLLDKEGKDLEFKGVPAYMNDFEPRYNKLIMIADQYMNTSPRLIEIKTLVRTTNELRNLDLSTLPENKLEQYLGILYSLELPENQSMTDEYNEIIRFRGNIEKNLYERVYKLQVDELKRMEVNDVNIEQSTKIKMKINTTNCKLCRTEINSSLIVFQNRVDNTKKELELTKALTTQSNCKDILINFLNNKDCILKNIAELQKNHQITTAQQFVIDEISKTFSSIDRLKDLVNANLGDFNIEELSSYTSNIETLKIKIDKEIKSNCMRFEEMCQNCQLTK